MRRTLVAHLLGVALICLPASPAFADKGQKGGHGKSAKHAAKVEKHKVKVDKHEAKIEKQEEKRRVDTTPRAVTRPRDVIVIDRDGNRRIIMEYYGREALPPGLAKRETLPPGLQKQLRERGHLPPGLQKRLTPVPAPLVTRLPAVPPYYARYFAGRDLIVIDQRTNRIVAIVTDVFPR